MDKSYYTETALPREQALDPAFRMLAEAVASLASGVRNLSDEIHGATGSAAASALSGPTPVQGWARDMHDMAAHSRLAAESALKEVYRIRETLGL